MISPPPSHARPPVHEFLRLVQSDRWLRAIDSSERKIAQSDSRLSLAEVSKASSSAASASRRTFALPLLCVLTPEVDPNERLTSERLTEACSSDPAAAEPEATLPLTPSPPLLPRRRFMYGFHSSECSTFLSCGKGRTAIWGPRVAVAEVLFSPFAVADASEGRG